MLPTPPDGLSHGLSDAEPADESIPPLPDGVRQIADPRLAAECRLAARRRARELMAEGPIDGRTMEQVRNLVGPVPSSSPHPAVSVARSTSRTYARTPRKSA